MIKFSEKDQLELTRLQNTVEQRRKESMLDQLAEMFKNWGKPKKEQKKVEEKIREYAHFCDSLKSTDSFVLVADALSDGILKEKDLSKDLFQQIEVMVRMMSH